MAVIGILPCKMNSDISEIRHSYTRATEMCGGVPLMLPYTRERSVIYEFTEICDGFLFTGGVDVEPSRYGQKTVGKGIELSPMRDEFELSLFSLIYKTKKPILAICRGIQLVNVCLGGTLYQDIESEIDCALKHSLPSQKFAHTVKIVKGTPLYQLAKREFIKVNSAHHQAIATLGHSLAVMATAPDGIIEAVYSTSYPYLRAYQWHPERTTSHDLCSKAIFWDFIKNCKAQNV